MIGFSGRPGRRHRAQAPSTPLAPEIEDRILCEVRRRIALGPAGRPGLPAVAWQRPLAVSLALVMALALVLTGTIRQGGSEPGLSAGPEGLLGPGGMTVADLAEVARSQPAQALDAENPYIHLVTDYVPNAAQRADGMAGWRDEQWIAADGSGRVRTLPLPGHDPTGNESDQPRAAGQLPVAGLLPGDVSDLPTDPEALRATLRDALDEPLRPEHPVRLLALPTLPPAVRAALVELLGLLGLQPTGPLGSDSEVVLGARVGEETVRVTFDARTTRPLTLEVSGSDEDGEVPAITAFHQSDVTPLPGPG